MKDHAYSEKELLIFQGVNKLLSEGESLHTLKVSDIATAAGIGKGTIYDYFSSKDEILRKALIYTLEKELLLISETLRELTSFKEKCYGIFNIIERYVKEHNSISNAFLFNLRPFEITGMLKNIHQAEELKNKTISKILRVVVNQGIEEGIIRDQDNSDLELLVFKSAILGFTSCLCHGLHSEEENKKVKDMAYSIIIKSLS